MCGECRGSEKVVVLYTDCVTVQTVWDALVVRILLPIIIMCPPYTVSVGRCGPAMDRLVYLHCTHVIDQSMCVVF